MELKDYPRPQKDTGIGVHWSPGNSGAVGEGDLRKKWIPQLQRMGVKWVKLLHPGGLRLAELLLEAEIMPVVRIFRHRPNVPELRQAVLKRNEIQDLKEFIAVGVKYFEFNNEPDLAGEWEKGELPAKGAIDHVARAAIVDMETILGLGGYPAVPAVSVGSQWDLIGKIIEHGGDYLFDEPVWIAIHNYDLNHPLEYPYDRVNRFGALLTPEEYRAMGTDAWTGSQWGTRTLAFVNEKREKEKNPRAKIHNDSSGFLSYERFAALSMKHLGRYLPIISTENGPIVGEDPDPRYPTTTPEIHAQKVVDMAKIMMGVSQRYDPAPDYYFATAFWLLGASILLAKGWEGHAWFSASRPNGHLPVVDALEQLKITPRQFDFSDEDSPILIPSGEISQSVVSGIIYGYPNIRVILRSANYAADTYTNDEGHFRIEKLPPGEYRISAPGAGLVKLGIKLDGENHVEIEMGAPESSPADETQTNWRAQVEDMGPAPHLGSIIVSVEGKIGLPVRISAKGWEGYVRETGSKPEYGPYALEFSPLGPGKYRIEPEGLDISPVVKLGSKQIMRVTCYLTKTEEEQAARQSRITGIITHGQGLRVILYQNDKLLQEVITADDGSFSFDSLPAGQYKLSVPDIEHEQEISLDGENQATVNLTAPDAEIPRYSTISGRVKNGAGRKIILKGPGGERVTTVGPDEYYQFDHLGPGQYYVRVVDSMMRRGGLKMTGRNHRQVNFTLPVSAINGSIIYGRVPQGAGWQLYVRGPENSEIIHPLDEDGNFQVGGLQAGEYEVILQGPQEDYVQHVTLDGKSDVKVEFDFIANENPQTSSSSSPAPSKEKYAEAEYTEEEYAEKEKPRGWKWKVEDIGPVPGFGRILVRIPHGQGKTVHLWADGWEGMVRTIGEKPELGPDVCEFAPLGVGKYYLRPAGMREKITVEMPGSHEIWITLTPGDEESIRASSSTPNSTYVLIKTPPPDEESFTQAMRFAARIGAKIGDSLEEAKQAQTIILLASLADFDEAAAEQLRQAGIRVIRITPQEYATKLVTTMP